MLASPAISKIRLLPEERPGAGGGDPTKSKVKLGSKKQTTNETPKTSLIEQPSRSQSVNGTTNDLPIENIPHFGEVTTPPTQAVNEKINEQIQKTPNLNISGVGQNLYPSVQDNTKQNIGTPINPKDPLAGQVQGGLLDTPAGKMLMDNLFMTGATKESTNQILQGLGEMTNGETSSKGFQRTVLGGLGLTGAPFTALDQLAQNTPDIGQFVSGMSSLPFMLMGEAGKISNQKVREFLGIKLADKEQEQLADEIAGVLAQFVIPMGIEGGVRKFGINPEKLVEIKTKIDAIPQEIKTPENIMKVVQGLLPEGSKFKNTVDPQGNVTREKIPTGDLTSSTPDKIAESKKNIEQNPRFTEPLPKVDNYAGINDLGTTEKFDITKGLKSDEPSKKQTFKEQVEPNLNHLLDLAKDPEDFMFRVQRQFPKNYEVIGNYLQDLGYTVEKGTKGLKEYFGRKPKEQINPKEEYIKNLPEITPEQKTRAKDFVDFKREANLNLNSVGDLKLDTFEIRKGLNDIKKDNFDTKEAKLVTDKINQAYEKGISGNNDRGDFRKPNYMTPDELKGLTEKPVEKLNSLNPTGNVLAEYTPEKRAQMELGDNITTLDKTSGKNPNDVVTIYRGAPKTQKEIVAGDYITTNPQLAKDYAGDGNVISKKVKLSDILDDKTEPLGEEYIYKPKVTPDKTLKPFPEYLDQVRKELGVSETGQAFEQSWKKQHKKLVEAELKKGKPVSDEVLKDYPELKKPEVPEVKNFADELNKRKETLDKETVHTDLNNLQAGDYAGLEATNRRAGYEGFVKKVNPKNITIETSYMGKPMELSFPKSEVSKFYKPKGKTTYTDNVKTIKQAISKKSLDMSGLSKLVDLTDKKVLKATFEIAKYHFENGLNKFGDWARQIVKDTGNWIKPHLKELWKYANGEKSIMGTGLSLNVPPPKDRKINKVNPERIPMGEKESQWEYNPKTVHGDIEPAIRQYVKDNIDKFKELRRGRITVEQTIKQGIKIANNLTVDKLNERLRNGETLNAEEHLGAIGFVSKHIKDVLADKNSTPIDKAEALFLHAKVSAVSGEVARSLNITQYASKMPLDEIKKLAEDVPEELKPEIDRLMQEFEKDPENPKLQDKLRYYIYNAMLSRPLTHARNIVGNISHLTYESLLTGDLGSVLRGLKRGGAKIKPTIAKILKEGGEDNKFFEGKQYEPKNAVLRNAMPLTWLKIEDVVFKELSKGIETEIQGKQIGKELKVSPETVIKGIENVMKGESLKNPAVNERLIKAVDEINGFADYVTFQKELGVTGKKFQGMINSIPGGFLVVPFIRTPANILKVGLQPLKLLKFASKEYRAEFRDMTPTMKRKELTRMTAGAMTMGLLAYLTANGTIDVTGQGAEDKSKKDFMEKQGWKPNSVKIGDKYISYQNVNPFNVFLGILGNYSDGMKYNYKPKDDELNIIQKMSKTTAGFVQTVTDQSFLQGLSNLAKWQETKDPYYFEQFLQMPVPGVLSAYKDIKGDNTAYETKTFGEKLSNRLGTTDGLKPRINVFGEPEKTSGTGLPIPTSETPDELSKTLLDNNVTISYPKKDIIKSDGQKVTDDEYYNFVKESGQRIKKKLDDNLGTIKTMDAGTMNDEIDRIVERIRNEVKSEMFGKKEKNKREFKLK